MRCLSKKCLPSARLSGIWKIFLGNGTFKGRMKMTIAILYREELKEYDFGPGHPFRGDRYEIFPPFLRARLPENDHYKILAAPWATDEDLLLICQQEYIEVTRNFYKAANLGLDCPGRFYEFHSGDNSPMGRPGKLEEAARLIIGQAKKACDLIETGQFRKVVSLGGGIHHAKPNRGEGFCLYNDVAFAGKYLIEKYGLQRILILDTDAHAGNGTAEYFYEDRRVLFIDLHQDPRSIYPGTGFSHQIGEEEGRGYTINLPLPVQAGDRCYRRVLEEIVIPVTSEFGPQIILRNGGSDPHPMDTLTSLGLSVNGFRMIGETVREMAQICGGKVIDFIGSGYNREILPYAWLALIAGLGDFQIQIEEPLPIPERSETDIPYEETKGIIKETKKILREYWSCFTE
jgi:acetoin utilization protein AcuC